MKMIKFSLCKFNNILDYIAWGHYCSCQFKPPRFLRPTLFQSVRMNYGFLQVQDSR